MSQEKETKLIPTEDISVSDQLKAVNNLRAKLEVEESLILDKALRSDDPNAIVKAMTYWQDVQKKEPSQIKSYLFDPYNLYQSLGFKDKPFKVSYNTLRYMARTPIVKAIISTRVEQVGYFSEPTDNEEEQGWMIRRKKRLYEDKLREITDKEKKVISDITQFIVDGGKDGNNWNADSFETFLRKIVHDALELDQMTFEVVRDRSGMPIEFIATDGATYRFAESIDIQHDQRQMINGYYPSFVQVYNGTIKNEFYPWELCFGLRNVTTDIMSNGYGRSELEDLIKIITWMLYGDSYNGKFFCISGDSLIITDSGIKEVKDLVGKDFKTWNGLSWEKSTAYKTGKKPLVRTKLVNGLEFKTSPDHLFYIISKDSQNEEPQWVKQSDLKEGDFCLVGYGEYENVPKEEDFFIGKRYLRTFTNPTGEVTIEKPRTFTPSKEILGDKDFWEVMGFAIGDGCFCVDNMTIHPHFRKDEELYDRFMSVLKRYDIAVSEFQCTPNQMNSEGSMGYRSLGVFHTTFLDWLYEIGFRKSANKKRIPNCIFNLSLESRCAFLRGLFSADGHREHHKSGYNTPSVYSQSSDLRQDILRLLQSVGVAANEVGRGWSKNNPNIFVQDIDAFVSKIRYIQDYKNEDTKRAKTTKNKWDLVAPVVGIELCKKIRQSEGWKNLNTREKETVNEVKSGGCKISRNKLKGLFQTAGLEIPDVLKYCHCAIDILDKVAIDEVEMYDIEVFDDKHLFLCNFVAVHNSQGAAPKGILKLSGNVNEDRLREFKQQWQAQVAGVRNAWKTPVLEADKMEWIDLQKNNRDMEFSNWNEYLIKLTCAIYKIDPTEIGFQLKSPNSRTMFEGSNDVKIKYSQEKGLKPLLKFIQRKITKYLVAPINPDYEFIFVGVDLEDEKQRLDSEIKKVGNFMGYKELRVKKGLPRDLEEDDLILNNVYMQKLSMDQQKEMQEKMQQEQGMGEEQSVGADDYMSQFFGNQRDGGGAEEGGGEKNPFSPGEEGVGGDNTNEDENPFMKSFNQWVDQMIVKSRY